MTDARGRARPFGRTTLPNPYPLDRPDGVTDLANSLAVWAKAPPLMISLGGTASAWVDACAECLRLGVPESDVRAYITRRTADHHREAKEEGRNPDPIHSLVYHAKAVTQWAQTYSAEAGSTPGKSRGLLSEGDDADTQIADAEAWRARRASGTAAS
ncbi:MAG: hypothetical protein GY937_22995 [bacterium]|nr:hypothetical protein [bacterium]